MVEVTTCSFCGAPAVAGIGYCAACGRALVPAQDPPLGSTAGANPQDIAPAPPPKNTPLDSDPNARVRVAGASVPPSARPSPNPSPAPAAAAESESSKREQLRSEAEHPGRSGHGPAEAIRTQSSKPVMSTVEMRDKQEAKKKIELDPGTDPRFVKATNEFQKLQSDFYAGAISKKRFEEEVEKLKIRDNNGDWWTIDPDKYQWMRFDGKSWVSEKPPKAAKIEKMPVEKEERPEKKSAEKAEVTPEPTEEPKVSVPPVPPPTTAQPSPPPTQNLCPSCGAAVKEGVRFCGSCGNQLERESILAPKQVLCPRCNAPIKPNVQFCAACGNPVPRQASPPSVCPHCGQQVKPGNKFCTKCGGSLDSKTPPPIRPPSQPMKPDVASGIGEDKAGLIRGPGLMSTSLSYLPGIAIDIFQHSSTYSKDPGSAINIILPSILSVVSVGLCPRIGKWVSIILVVVALGWLLLPIFGGGKIVDNSGRGIVGISFFYTLMQLLRSVKK